MTLITFVYNINLHHSLNFIHPAQYGLISHRQVILELTVYSVTQERQGANCKLKHTMKSVTKAVNFTTKALMRYLNLFS